jgi:DNA-binding beta-propeller fold protein YncE
LIETHLLILTALLGAAPQLEVTTLLTFDRALGETPENLTFDRDGNVYLTLLLAHTVVRLDARGHVDRVVLPGTQAAGVEIDPRHPDRLTVAVSSPDAAVAGLWTVPLAAFDGGAAPSRAVALPTASFPNGIAYDRDGTLYVADSTLGRIWRVRQDRDAAEVWLSDPALAPTGATDGPVLPGANGVKLARGRIWVSNTSSSSLLSAPIAADGSPGALSVAFDHLFEIDDFLITPRGEVIAALNGANQVVSIAPGGRTTVLEDEAAGARNPTAVALSDCGDLYVTNAAFLFPDGATLELLTR